MSEHATPGAATPRRAASAVGVSRASARRSDLAVSAALAVAIAGGGAWIGYTAYLPGTGPSGTVTHGGLFPATFATILLQNLGAVLLAFTGVMTFGVGTLAALMTTSAWVGATAHAAVAEAGAASVAGRALPYAVFEFAGLLLAAMGGLYPAVVLVTSPFRDGARQRLGDAVQTALLLLGAGAVLVVVGAAVEATLIAVTQP